MKNAESLKGKIRNLSKKNRLSSMEILQMYFFERFLERLSKSEYRVNFIIKGGFLISSILGVENRTTMDIDTTIKGLLLTETSIREIIATILSIDVNDGISFKVTSIEYIREDDEYDNFRVHLIANFDKIKNPMKIDITTGDEITPKAVDYSYSCLFEDKEISLRAYPIETILAEKFESIIQRNVFTTRMRDFYDIYSLYQLRRDEIDFEILHQAIIKTATKRGSFHYFEEFNEIIKDMREDSQLLQLWLVYLKENQYIGQLEFTHSLDVIVKIAELTILK